MRLSHSPSSASHKKNIFQKLFGKVRGTIMSIGILGTPVVAQTGNSISSTPKIPPIEERLASSQKMNLESFKSIQELENTMAFLWSQLKDTPGAPKEIRDQYGHITTEGLMWIESELPADYLRYIQKYKNMERELEKMDKKDSKYGTLEYSLMCLGALLMGVVGYRLGKVSKKELDKLKNEHRIAHDEATKHMRERALAEGKNTVLTQKIAELKQQKKKGWKDGKTVDAEIVEPGKETTSTLRSLPEIQIAPKEMPEWLQDTFLAQDEFNTLQTILTTDLSSKQPSEEAKQLQESIQRISDTTGTKNERAQRLNAMSENLISYARLKRVSEETIYTLLRELEKSFQGQEIYFGCCPVIDQPFDNTQMLQIGQSKLSVLKVSKVLSLPVFGPNTHPQATTKKIAYTLAKVHCS